MLQPAISTDNDRFGRNIFRLPTTMASNLPPKTIPVVRPKMATTITGSLQAGEIGPRFRIATPPKRLHQGDLGLSVGHQHRRTRFSKHIVGNSTEHAFLPAPVTVGAHYQQCVAACFTCAYKDFTSVFVGRYGDLAAQLCKMKL